MERRNNWIEGAQRPARGEAYFEVRRSRSPGTPQAAQTVGAWPRSGSAEAESAIDVLARHAGRWAAERPERRAELVDSARAALVANPDPDGEIEATLGLAPAGLARCRRVAARGVADSSGITLVRRHWGELLGGAAAVFDELARGCVVLLVGDPRVPALADRVVRVALHAGVPAGAIALLHDDGDTAVRAALATGRVDRWSASGPPGDRERLEVLAAATVGRAAFGAGVVEAQACALTFQVLERAVASVTPDDDPVESAGRIARAAFGRIETMSGQLPGQVGVVEVHPLRLSQFTAALLQSVEGEIEEEPMAAFLEPGLARTLRRRRDLGLDEGATLIHEGHVPGSRHESGDATLARLVFTNVEPHMRLLARSRPAPTLLLVRRGE